MPVLASPPVVQAEEAKTAAIDEIDGSPILLVEISRSRWRIIASLVPLLLLLTYSGMFLWAGLSFDGAGVSRRTPPGLWIRAPSPRLPSSSRCSHSCPASYPEFAVEKDGIRLPFDGRRARTSRRGLGASVCSHGTR